MTQTHEDDLFRGSSMTFGEHLEELRKRLFRAAMWLALGVVVGLAFGQKVVNWIQTPLTHALKDYYRDVRLAQLRTEFDGTVPSDQEELLQGGYLSEPFYVEPARLIGAFAYAYPSDHELRELSTLRLSRADLLDAKRLAAAMEAAVDDPNPSPAKFVVSQLVMSATDAVDRIAKAEVPKPADVDHLADGLDRMLLSLDFYDAASFASLKLPAAVKEALAAPEKLSVDELHRRNWQILCFVWPDLIAEPHTDLVPITIWHKAADDSHVKLIATGTTDPFVIYVKVSLLVGFILVSPLIFREIWLFVAAGLYPHERRYVYTFLPFSIGLFLAGAFMAFFVAFPPVLKFLLSFNEFLGIAPEPRISEWLTFVLFLPLAFGIGFQLPLVMLFVHRLGLVSVHTYLVQWRVAVLVILVTATLLCPSPDLYSMLLMAGPMVVLYFGGIALCHYSAKRRPQALGGE